MKSPHLTPQYMRDNKARNRAKWAARGLRCVHEIYVHPQDFPAVARYIDAMNARRFPNPDKRPPRLIQPQRPRGAVTVKEAAERLSVDEGTVRQRIYRGALKRLPVRGLHRAHYLTEASVRREERALAGFTTRQAAAYLSSHGYRVRAERMHKWRFAGKGPTFHVHMRSVRYTRAALNTWLGLMKHNSRKR